MKRQCLAFVLPVLPLVASLGAKAAVSEQDFQARTTAELVNLCSASQSDPLAAAAIHFCEGFLVGTYRTLSGAQSGMRRKLFCVTCPVPTRNQATADFVAWARTSPNVMSEQPSDTVLRYLTQHYPCTAQ